MIKVYTARYSTPTGPAKTGISTGSRLPTDPCLRA
jgi:hypothetical protein